MVADVTLSPVILSTGILSPVITDSSTEVLPLIITPSAGILSPGRTTTSSPTDKSSTEISTSSPSRITFAVFGARDISFFKASLVLPFAFASRYFPTVIRVTIVPADSKYRFLLYSSTKSISP